MSVVETVKKYIWRTVKRIKLQAGQEIHIKSDSPIVIEVREKTQKPPKDS